MRLFEFISGINTSLMEASAKSRYLKMFSVFPEGSLKPVQIQYIEKNIEWAQKILKKDDRIIWYLRYIRLSLFNELNNPQFKDAVTKEINNMARKGSVSNTDIITGIDYVVGNQFKNEIVHLLGLPIHELKNMSFGWNSPRELISNMKEIEQDFIDDRDRLIDDNPEHQVVIDFGDGFAWYDLGTASCDIEAGAMGHCGNSPRADSNDTIISLRKTIKMGDAIKKTPVLTFILDEHGFLTEMKGRGNQKPAARYHKYIVPLLKHNRIEGITGGGYMPENNFNVYDLPSAVRQELLKEKPELMSLSDYIEEKNPNLDQLDTIIRNRLNMYDISGNFSLRKEGNDIELVLDYWDGLYDFAKEIDDTAVISILDAMDDIGDVNTTISEELKEPEFIEQVLRRLPKKYIKMAYDSVGVNLDSKKIRIVADRLISNQTNFYQNIIDSISVDEDEYKELLQDRLDAYVERGWYFAMGSAGIRSVDDGGIELVCSLRDMIEMLEAAADPDNDWGNFYGDVYELRRNGLTSLMPEQDRSEDHGSENVKPPLADMYEDDPIVRDGVDVDDLSPSDVAKMFIDRMEGRIDDPRQGELPNLSPREF